MNLAFGGEYTLFAGLEECLKFVRDYNFHPTDIEYLRASLPTYIESEFFDYLSTLNMNDIKIYAVPEGNNNNNFAFFLFFQKLNQNFLLIKKKQEVWSFLVCH